MAEIRDLFRKQFSYLPAHIVRAPAAIELIGAGSALRHGLAISATLDCPVEIACAPRSDGKCCLASRDSRQTETFRPDTFVRNLAAPWSDFPKAILQQFHKRKLRLGGFDAVILDQLPAGTGLNRYATLQVATVLTLRALFPFRLARSGPGLPPERDGHGKLPPLAAEECWELASLCRAASHKFLGIECHSVEHAAAFFAKAWHLLSIDAPLVACDTLPLFGCVCILSREVSLQARPNVTEMNELAKNLDAAARKLGLKSLRTAELGLVKANRNRLSGREYDCACYAVAETARAVAAEHALRNNDIAQFAAYVEQSNDQLLSLHGLQAQSPLLQLGRTHAACFGGRLVPGCVGGAAVHLVMHHLADDFMRSLATQYQQQTGRQVRSWVCTLGDSNNSA
jgi:galactokinase